MAIAFVRVDCRYVHGQVGARLVREFGIHKIALVSDVIAKDAFMVQLYTAAGINGADIVVYTVEKALEAYQNGEFNKQNVMLLFGDIDTAKRTYDAGVHFNSLNIGNAKGGTDKLRVDQTTYISLEEGKELLQLHKNGVDIYFQAMPNATKTSLEKALTTIGLE